jgi:RNA polymerase-binding transcription factor DksA
MMNALRSPLTAEQRGSLHERLLARAACADISASAHEQVMAALGRLAAGSYGLCIECGTPLPWKRLDMLPEAARCARCDNEQQRRRALPAHPTY